MEPHFCRMGIFKLSGENMKITEDLIPQGRINRPGSKNSCEYITVHETANPKRGANAKNHAKYLKTVNGQTSWHYTVDDRSIYRHIPDCEKSYHTSDRTANESSIAIEICVNADGDFKKACDLAAGLIRELSLQYGIPVTNIKRHYDWTGKDCPAQLMKDGWEEFLRMCNAESDVSVISVEELKNMGYTHIAL